MISEESVYKIGRLGKPHGIKGEISMQFQDDVFDRTESEYLILKIDGILVPFFMEEYRFRNDESVLMKFCDIDTQERAAQLTGCEVFFPRHLSDSTEKGMTWAETVGFALKDSTSDKVIGHIISVDDTTINILLELDNGILVPAAEELITAVDSENREITMTVPEGLADL
ncbi:ribosome maturation factor RimM [Xylanibacter muris]|uniref:Ribosome maturation factor RimM n=1 Tax=Xylanibacter muris TaxID=2736290 RepID=A0ABX2AJ04_9BACT|nr:ribosome maturation factor RimM [Xylanibacter muris]NPD91084.1 16S rRNA processing protein RimM [Xylanibacter muris]